MQILKPKLLQLLDEDIFATDDVALVQAKAAAWQEYSAQLQTILTAEQYQTMQQKKTERRNALLNQLKEEQQ